MREKVLCRARVRRGRRQPRVHVRREGVEVVGQVEEVDEARLVGHPVLEDQLRYVVLRQLTRARAEPEELRDFNQFKFLKKCFL